VLAADALALGGGTLGALAPETLAALDASLPATWSHGNPVDIIGDAPVQRYADALKVLLAAPEVDAVLFAHAPTAVVPATEIAQGCLPLVQDARKPVLGCWLGGPAVAQARRLWSAAGIPSYDTPERAAAAWLQLATHARNQALLQQAPAAAREGPPPDRALAQSLVDDAVRLQRDWLDEVQAKQVLEAYGIRTVATRRALDGEEAAQLAAEIGFPVALKVISPQVVHKSDVGGVVLDLHDGEQVRAAAVRMRQGIARLKPDAHVLGFAVQKMAKPAGGRELIVGVANDAVFGPVILCGAGGTDVELAPQHAVALPPLDAVLADDLVVRSGIKPLLAASRGRPALDEPGLHDVLLKISQLVCEVKGLAELDINPLVVDAGGVIALDARVRVAGPGRRLAPLAIRPYPAELEGEIRLGDAALRVRPIRPEDEPRLADFYAHASPADMRLRFFMVRRDVPHSELARYSQIDYDREMTFIALGPDGAMAGEVRAVCDPDNERAEFALQVAGAWQGKGLGTQLLQRMVAYLRSRGTKEVVGECLPENPAMAAVARQVGMEVRPNAQAGTLAMRLALRA
jgi:acetyltransferase